MIIEQTAPLWCDLGWEGEVYFSSQPCFSLGNVLAPWPLHVASLAGSQNSSCMWCSPKLAPPGIVFPGVFFPLHCIYSKISLINFCSKPLQDVVYIHICSGILFSHMKRNGFESVAVRWMNLEPYTEWHKSEREQVSYINAYTWNIDKWD